MTRRRPIFYETEQPPPADTGGWRAHGLCAGSPCPELWDESVEGETRKERDARHAIALNICARCPVKAECVDAAVAAVDEGVRGGFVLTPLASYQSGHARKRTA